MSTQRGLLVCFIGIDGSGKTTMANYTAESLNLNGKPFKYVYARFLPFLVKPIWALARLLFAGGKNIVENYSDYTTEKKTRLKNPLYKKAHLFLVFFDYFFQMFFKVELNKALRRNLVCDRYVYDTVVTDLAPDLGLSTDEMLDLIDFSFRFLSKPEIVFWVDVPEEVSLSRKNDILAREYLTERRAFYNILSEKYQFIELDGTQSLDELKGDIENYLQNYLKEIK